MKQSDGPLFLEMITGMAEIYGKSLSDMAISMYWNALEGYSIAEVRTALNTCVRSADNGQYMPKPADIIRHIDGDSSAKASLAWGIVVQTIRRVGTGKSVCFEDPLIHCVLRDMGGWQQLGKMKVEDEPFRAAEFERRYRAYAQNKPKEYPRYLPGAIDQHNSALGQEPSNIVRVGDPIRCQLVFENGSSGSNLQLGKIGDALPNKVLKLVKG